MHACSSKISTWIEWIVFQIIPQFQKVPFYHNLIDCLTWPWQLINFIKQMVIFISIVQLHYSESSTRFSVIFARLPNYDMLR